MLKSRYTLVASAACVALVGTFIVTTPLAGYSQGSGKGQPPGPDVRVINKPSEPVPVSLQGTGQITGDVNVINSPTVKIASGSKVGIDPACDGVTVTNTASQPVPIAGTVRDIDQPAMSPHQDGFGFAIASGFTTSEALTMVPAGKRLVIEQFSATAIVPAGQSGFFFIQTTAGGGAAQHIVPATKGFADSAFPGSDLLTASQSIRIYADPGTTPTVSFRRSSSAGSSTFSAFISGYHVTLAP